MGRYHNSALSYTYHNWLACDFFEFFDENYGSSFVCPTGYVMARTMGCHYSLFAPFSLVETKFRDAPLPIDGDITIPVRPIGERSQRQGPVEALRMAGIAVLSTVTR